MKIRRFKETLIRENVPQKRNIKMVIEDLKLSPGITIHCQGKREAYNLLKLIEQETDITWAAGHQPTQYLPDYPNDFHIVITTPLSTPVLTASSSVLSSIEKLYKKYSASEFI